MRPTKRGKFALEHKLKRKRLRRQRKLKALILLITLAVLGWATAKYVLVSPYFEIEIVRVEGANRLPQEKVLKWANISSGKSIFQVNLKKIAKRVSSSSLVKRVEVKRVLPSTVLIRIEERIPFVYLSQKGNFYEIDNEGVILGKGEKNKDLPIIVGISSSSESEKIKSVVRLLRVTEELGLFFSRVKMNSRGTMVGYLKNGPAIYLGEKPYLAYLSYLPSILAERGEKGRDIKYVDIRFRNQIVVGTQ